MQVFYDKDADLALIQAKKVAIIGYGSQGHAHANNLKESGVDVTVGLAPSSHTRAKVEAAGIKVASVDEASSSCDLVMMLAPDELHPEIYRESVAGNLKKGGALVFAHGFNIHFGVLEPRPDLDVFMIAPKGPGHLVRSTYVEGGGVPCLIAIQQDESTQARELALAYASAIGGGRAGIIATSFREETETDLFGEQCVLCGGLVSLVEAGFDTLVEGGYAPEMAYFECLHELKLIVDLLYEGGISNLNYSISNTAEYGSVSRGPRLVNHKTRAEMKKILAEIQNGVFAREFIGEHHAGAPVLKASRRRSDSHPLEQVGAKLRNMMPWLAAGRLVDKARN